MRCGACLLIFAADEYLLETQQQETSHPDEVDFVSGGFDTNMVRQVDPAELPPLRFDLAYDAGIHEPVVESDPEAEAVDESELQVHEEVEEGPENFSAYEAPEQDSAGEYTFDEEAGQDQADDPFELRSVPHGESSAAELEDARYSDDKSDLIQDGVSPLGQEEAEPHILRAEESVVEEESADHDEEAESEPLEEYSGDIGAAESGAESESFEAYSGASDEDEFDAGLETTEANSKDDVEAGSGSVSEYPEDHQEDSEAGSDTIEEGPGLAESESAEQETEPVESFADSAEEEPEFSAAELSDESPAEGDKGPVADSASAVQATEADAREQETDVFPETVTELDESDPTTAEPASDEETDQTGNEAEIQASDTEDLAVDDETEFPPAESLERLDLDQLEAEALSDLIVESETSYSRSRVTWFLGSSLLVVMLAGQFVFFNRNHLAQNPEYRPYLMSACETLGCELISYRDDEALQTSRLLIRSHEEVDDALTVDVLLSNTSMFRQQFPALELSFRNVRGTLVASRRFGPGEYLSGELSGLQYIPARTEVRLHLEIYDPGPEAVNYQMQVVR